MHLPRSLVSVMLACLIMPAGLLAQQVSDPMSVLFELDVGERIRVLAPPEPMVEGRVASVYVQSLVLYLEAPGPGGEEVSEWTTEIGSIDAVWTRGRQTWLGAAIGAGAGVILGGLTMWAASGLCEYDCDADAGDYVLGTLLFGGAGTLLGALIGSAFPRWSLQFER